MGLIDLTGQTFGRLTVLERAPRPAFNSHTDAYWRCRCKCGTETVVRSVALRSGNTRSCGCLRSDLNRKRGKKGVS